MINSKYVIYAALLW